MICLFFVYISPTLFHTDLVSFCVIALKVSLFCLRTAYNDIEPFGYLNLHNNRRLRLVQNSFGQHIKYTVNAITDDNRSKYLICSTLNQSRTRSNRLATHCTQRDEYSVRVYIIGVCKSIFILMHVARTVFRYPRTEFSSRNKAKLTSSIWPAAR